MRYATLRKEGKERLKLTGALLFPHRAQDYGIAQYNWITQENEQRD